MTREKMRRVLLGLVLSLVTGLFVFPAWGIAVASVVGFVKEIVQVDLSAKGIRPRWDMFWLTFAGGVFGAAIANLL